LGATQRGWTLDVLNIVRRLCEVGTARCAVRAPGGRKIPAALPPGTSQRDVPTNTFTTADAYVFTHELEKLHPDNSDKSRAGSHVRDNPVNKDTGQESANNFKFFRLHRVSARQGAMRDCYFIPVVANGGYRSSVRSEIFVAKRFQ
jgi:hypothetical protein